MADALDDADLDEIFSDEGDAAGYSEDDGNDDDGGDGSYSDEDLDDESRYRSEEEAEAEERAYLRKKGRTCPASCCRRCWAT